jgi:hypothetical protein
MNLHESQGSFRLTVATAAQVALPSRHLHDDTAAAKIAERLTWCPPRISTAPGSAR